MTTTLETPNTLDVPVAACFLSMPDNFVKLADGETGEDGKITKKPRFAMQVNSGKPMSHWWYGILAVNLSGVEWQGSSIAALLDHDVTKRLGFTTKLFVDDKTGLMAEGVMLSNEEAQSVRRDSSEGFPFQASCYLEATKLLRLEDGAEHEVNGYTVTGPALIFEASNLREVTMCALGQDPNTSSDASLSGDAVETIRIPLSVKASAMTTKKEPTPATPAAPEVDADAVRLEAQQAEQQRVTDILELAADCQVELAKKLIEDSTAALTAAKILIADMREREKLASPSSAATPSTTPISAPAPSPTPTGGDELALLDAMEEGEDKWRAQWKADKKLRAEFTNEGVWMSYQNNKHRCRDYGGNRKDFDAKTEGNN